MNKKKFEYIPVPRYILSDYRARKLIRSEFWLYVWIRLNANLFGRATVTIAGLRDDVFPHLKGKAGENTVTKYLTSLKRKKYLYYPDRQGRRGSFEVQLNDWLGKGGVVFTLDKPISNKPVSVDQSHRAEPPPEVSQKSEAIIQNLEPLKQQLAQTLSADRPSLQFRTSNTNTETEKQTDNKTYNTLEKNSFKYVKVSDFTPKSGEELRCQQIAAAVGDTYINPLLSILKEYGLPVIERAYGMLLEDFKGGRTIQNRAAYLTAIIKNLTHPPPNTS